MQRTINLKIPYDERIAETVRLYNTACNVALKAGFIKGTYNKTKIHDATYQQIRRKHRRLNSSYVCAARDQASDMLKRERLKRLPVKKQHSSIRLNHNTFTPFLDSGSISLSTLKGRIRIPVRIPEYYKQYASWKIASATMGIKGRTIVLHLIADSGNTPAKIIPKKIIGIDRGIINPVVSSDNQFFNSRNLRRIKGRYQWLKARLQSKGTPSAKRHLQRLSGRERRFVRDINHVLSKRIADGEADTFCFGRTPNQKGQETRKTIQHSFGQLELRAIPDLP